MKRIITIFIVSVMLLGLSSAFAIDAGESRAVIGADLTDEQINKVYSDFSVTRGNVKELRVTNAEERKYLDGLVSSDIIGSRSISCVYIEILPENSGLDVTTSPNISWCSKEMYRNALITAGIDNAKVIVTAPISGISGTAALTGIYKAYEDITGEPLDDTAKLVGTQELVITAELADEIGKYDAAVIVNELKLILSETKNMSDDEVKEQIRIIAEQYSVSITEGQIDQLISLCRSLEGLSTEELQAKVESVQSTLVKLADAKDTAGKVIDSVKGFFSAIGDFFSNIFSKITGN